MPCPVDYSCIEKAIRAFNEGRKFVKVVHLSKYMLENKDTYLYEPCSQRYLRIKITEVLLGKGWERTFGYRGRGNAVFGVPWVTDEISDAACMTVSV